MLNAEKYKKEILEITEKGYYFAVSKDRQNIVGRCDGIECKNCIFDDDECAYNLSRMKWLLSEYKEPIKLTRLEFEILKWLDKEGYKFIVRSPGDNLMVHDSTPKKGFDVWISENRYKTLTSFNELFQFIQWHDKEPTSIQDVLRNCEVVNENSSD